MSYLGGVELLDGSGPKITLEELIKSCGLEYASLNNVQCMHGTNLIAYFLYVDVFCLEPKVTKRPELVKM